MIQHLFITLLLVPVATASTGIDIKNVRCRGITVESYSLTCAEYKNGPATTCTYGTELNFEGKVTYPQNLPSATVDARADVTAFMGLWRHELFNRETELCNDKSITPLDGQECPAGGQYRIATSITLPGDPNGKDDWWAGVTVTGHIHINQNGREVGMCSVVVKTFKSGGGYSMAYGAAGAALFGIALAGGIAAKRRRWRISTETTEESYKNFDETEMTSTGSRLQVV